MFELCKHDILFFNIDADKIASLYMLFLTLYAYAQLVDHYSILYHIPHLCKLQRAVAMYATMFDLSASGPVLCLSAVVRF